MYKKEIEAIKKAHRFRDRIIYEEDLIDLASNDYLGFSQNKELFERAVEKVSKYPTHAPKASVLVNGYHEIHKELEDYLCMRNGFECALTVGSGFLANLSLLESLPRNKDVLFIDEEYHASGIMASKLSKGRVITFKHNDPEDLRRKIKNETKSPNTRVIIAVEGIYSMSGELLDRQIFDIADENDAILIVDEAHSVGVLGENLNGVFELFGIKPKDNHIKMGTLGKALGSYGAYILASDEICKYLQNRAKPIIYATAPSVFDIALAHEGFLEIEKNKDAISKKIKQRQKLTKKHFNKEIKGLILTLEAESSAKALGLREEFLKKGFLIGAIRPPTVNKPILRIIPRISIKDEIVEDFYKLLLRESF